MNNFSWFCIFTSTKYDNDFISNIRYPLFLKLLDNCHQLWIDIVFVDSSTNDSFLNQIKNYTFTKMITVSDNGVTLWEKRRLALKETMNSNWKDIFMYIEPEKFSLINESFLSQAISIIEKWYDCVIPHRIKLFNWKDCFASKIEWLAIDLVNYNILKSSTEYDFRFWPKIFNKNMCKLFLKYNRDWNHTDRWDSIIIPFIQAVVQWYKINSLGVDYCYTDEELNLEHWRELQIKRIDQFECIMKEILKIY